MNFGEWNVEASIKLAEQYEGVQPTLRPRPNGTGVIRHAYEPVALVAVSPAVPLAP
jgi:hypothetical protein